MLDQKPGTKLKYSDLSASNSFVWTLTKEHASQLDAWMNEALIKPTAGRAPAGSSHSDAIVSPSSSASYARLDRQRDGNGQSKKIMQDLYS